MSQNKPWVIIGSELSPFTLKLELMCHYVGLPYRMLPKTGSTLENARYLIRKERLTRGQIPLLWPQKSTLDEYPLVPFLFGPNGENLYDSSAIGEWLDQHSPLPNKRPKLIPTDNEAAQFLCHLIDEFADEFMLYLVHHNRWKQSAKDNNAGDRLATELKSMLGPCQTRYSHWFSNRQVKRMPYLFSVAKRGTYIENLPPKRQPPDRAGFPATHNFLETIYLTLLDELNRLLEERDFLISSQFTMADASIYGQLAMNLKDSSTQRLIATRAPALLAWLEKLNTHQIPLTQHEKTRQPKQVPPPFTHLKPLLKTICDIYVPLMHQNTKAWINYKEQGETIFNEKAFWRNRALFDGSVQGQPYRSVVKTFQVKSWLAIREKWEQLSENAKKELQDCLPGEHGLDKDY